MKFRTFVSTLLAVVLVLLTLGVGGFWKLTARTPLSLLKEGGQAAPSAAIFVPKQAPVMVSLLVNPERLAFLRRVLVWPGARRRARAEIDQIERTLLANTGLTYREDIQPWLGDEVTFAVTASDIDRDQRNGDQPGYLLVLTSRDQDRARDFIQLFWQKRAMVGADLVFEQYSGVKLIYGSRQARSDSGPGADRLDEPAFSADRLASAVVGGRFILFANEPAVLRQAINTVQVTDLNLDSSTAYRRTLETLSANPVGLAFVNLPQFTDWLDAPSASMADQTADSVDRTDGFEHALIALKLDRHGLLANTTLLAAAGEHRLPVRPVLSQPVGALKYMPAEAALVAAGTDLPQTWSQLMQAIRPLPTLAKSLNQPLEDIQTRWGLEPETLFPAITGEYALGMLPLTDPSTPDWLLVIQKNAAAAVGIEQLDALAEAQGLSIAPLTLAGQAVSAWTKIATESVPLSQSEPEKMMLKTEVEGLHTQLEGYELFANSVETMDLALKTRETSLLDSGAFQQAIASLSRTNNGYLYLDWPAVKVMVEERAPLIKFLELIGQPFFTHLESLTISGYGGEADLQQGGIFLRLVDR